MKGSILNVNEKLLDYPEYTNSFGTYCAMVHDFTYQYFDMTTKQDLKKISSDVNVKSKPFFIYEQKWLQVLHNRLQLTNAKALEIENAITNGEKTLLIDIIEPVVDKILAQKVDDAVKNNSLKELCQKTYELCSSLLELIDELQRPPYKPRVAFLTDTGPAVGVSNCEVNVRDAELARMYNSDYRIRLHRSRGDSGQGEAERTNSVIADSIVDGATIDWEVH